MDNNPSSNTEIKYTIKKPKKTKYQKLKHEVQMFVLDRPLLKGTLSWLWIALATILSAICFAYGYRAFIAPAPYQGYAIPALISGGASGVSQVILRIIEICGYTPASEKDVSSILYLIVNIPLFIIAWIFIGKKFTLVTIVNVILTSLLIKYIPESWVVVFNSLPNSVQGNKITSGIPFQYDYLARALIAGCTTGASAAISYVIGTSAGGTDIIAFSIAEKKSTNVGKYSVIINCITVLSYTVLNTFRLQKLGQNPLAEMPMVLYTIVYFIVSSKVTDLINIKNKKTELQINTDHSDLPEKLMRIFPHGCTIVNAIGGYTGKQRKLVYMVVSASEVKQVISYAKQIDPNCFVNVIHSHQVFGNFYIKPLK